jgi:hypothetical protein
VPTINSAVAFNGSLRKPKGKPATHSLRQWRLQNVTVQKGTKILRDNGRRFLVVSKELCYGKAETLEDAEEAVRGWRYNLER